MSCSKSPSRFRVPFVGSPRAPWLWPSLSIFALSALERTGWCSADLPSAGACRTLLSQFDGEDGAPPAQHGQGAQCQRDSAGLAGFGCPGEACSSAMTTLKSSLCIPSSSEGRLLPCRRARGPASCCLLCHGMPTAAGVLLHETCVCSPHSLTRPFPYALLSRQVDSSHFGSRTSTTLVFGGSSGPGFDRGVAPFSSSDGTTEQSGFVFRAVSKGCFAFWPSLSVSCLSAKISPLSTELIPRRCRFWGLAKTVL